jgi:dTDP-4-dehydrorhamnose reductase
MLGRDLEKSLLGAGFDVGVFDLPEFDITAMEQVGAVVEESDIIVNCAAFTNVDGAESAREAAYAINAEAVGQLGRLAKRCGVYVMHISTDFVFDGSKEGAYDENDEPRPLSVYGTTKYQGEQLLAESGCRGCIIRPQWTYGEGGNNFVSKMLELGGRMDALRVVDDQVGAPTATTEVAGAICELISRDEPVEGLYHYAAAGYVSRCDQARFVFAKAGWDVTVEACKTSDFASAAQRPLNSRFNCEKIQKCLSNPIRDWQGPLGEFLELI